jgi:hypothetical protein
LPARAPSFAMRDFKVLSKSPPCMRKARFTAPAVPRSCLSFHLELRNVRIVSNKVDIRIHDILKSTTNHASQERKEIMARFIIYTLTTDMRESS